MATCSSLIMYASLKQGTDSQAQTLTLIFVRAGDPADITVWYIQRIEDSTQYKLLVEAPEGLSSIGAKTCIGEFPTSPHNQDAVAEEYLAAIIERLQCERYIVKGRRAAAMSKEQIASFSKDLQIAMLAVCTGDSAELDFGGFELPSGAIARVQWWDAVMNTI
ncbi:hypothetical protein BDW67DRAFT_188160 [Aspergillus spinulosporus]